MSYFLENQKSILIPPLTFNNNDVKKCPHRKHLGIVLDPKLDFSLLSANPTKWSNTLKQFFGKLRH